MKTEDDDWRRLCRSVADESDPQRLSALVDELIQVLDKRRQENKQDGPDVETRQAGPFELDFRQQSRWIG
jgi:hypothetical protein